MFYFINEDYIQLPENPKAGDNALDYKGDKYKCVKNGIWEEKDEIEIRMLIPIYYGEKEYFRYLAKKEV